MCNHSRQFVEAFKWRAFEIILELMDLRAIINGHKKCCFRFLWCRATTWFKLSCTGDNPVSITEHFFTCFRQSNRYRHRFRGMTIDQILGNAQYRSLDTYIVADQTTNQNFGTFSFTNGELATEISRTCAFDKGNFYVFL